MEVAPPVSHRHDSKPCFEGQQPLGVPDWIATELLTLRLAADISRNCASGYMPTAMKSEESPKPEGLAAGDWIERGQREAVDGACGGGGGGGAGREEGAFVGGAGAVGQQTGPAQETSQLDPRAPVRKGKWTPEEEMYTTRIINDFNKGLLPLAPGTTLRSYLSEKLNCDPMRITKKFAGASCIGKRVFMPAERTPENLVETHRSRLDLEEMARKFHNRLETMRPGAGGSGRSSGSGIGSSGGGSSRGAGVLGSTPAAKARRSPARGSGAVAGCGGTGASSSMGGGARRGESSAGSGAKPSAGRGGGGAGDSGGSGACSSRSPSPGAHGPHSACDDSAPHPEGSPGRRSRSWERDEEGGYGQYDSMDQSPSGADSDDSERHCGGGGGIIGSAPFAGDSGRGGSYGGHSHAEGQSNRGHSAGYSRCSYDACLVGGRGDGDQETNDYGRSSSSGSSSSSGGGSSGRRIGQHIINNTLDGFHRHGARRSYNFHTASTVSGRGHGVATTEDHSDDQQQQRQHSHRDEGDGAAAAVAVTLAARLSPMAVGGTRGESWGGQGSSSTSSLTGSVTGSSGQPRTLPPAALSSGTGNREGPGGGGSGARSPTWPLPRAIPEGAEMSDQDAGGLLIGFFRSVQEKAQTASDELEECMSQADEQQKDQGATGGLHPLVATKRGFRSISSPALTQFAHYAEGLPRLQTPPFKRRKSVSSFV